MDRKFTLITDAKSDLPEKFREENDVHVIPVPYFIDEVEYTGIDGNKHEIKEFYDIMKNGAMPTTSHINPAVGTKVIGDCLEYGKEILIIGFSSALSASYFREKSIADEFNEDPNNPRIYVVDSKMATMGQSLMVWYATKMRDEGKTAKEVYDWCIEHNNEFCAYVAPNDLFHLQRGGRLSKASALFGTMLGVKPILHIDTDGKLGAIDKVRGRKASLDAIVDRMVKQTEGIDNELVTIGHGDCYEDAVYVMEQVKKKTPYRNFMIDYIGPVIGTHAGPGTVALFFMGKSRELDK